MSGWVRHPHQLRAPSRASARTRIAAMGFARRAPTRASCGAKEGFVEEAMEAGRVRAVGRPGRRAVSRRRHARRSAGVSPRAASAWAGSFASDTRQLCRPRSWRPWTKSLPQQAAIRCNRVRHRRARSAEAGKAAGRPDGHRGGSSEVSTSPPTSTRLGSVRRLPRVAAPLGQRGHPGRPIRAAPGPVDAPED